MRIQVSKRGKDGKRDGKEKPSKWPKKKKREIKVGDKGQVTDVKKSRYFLCNGLLQVKDCLTKGKISAIVTAATKDKEEETLVQASTLHKLRAMRARRTASGEVGLMFVLVVVNEWKVSALANTGVIHSFISKGMANELRLKSGINAIGLRQLTLR